MHFYQEHEEYVKTPEQVWTRAERIWAGETARMPLRACMGKHRVQELLVCDVINLIYELRTLIWCTDWQHCEGLPTFLRQCERQLTCLDYDFLSLSPAFFFFFLFPESIWWRRPEREIGVRGQIPLCSNVQGNYIFYTFRKNFPTSPQLSHMGAHMDCSGNERTAFVAV